MALDRECLRVRFLVNTRATYSSFTNLPVPNSQSLILLTKMILLTIWLVGFTRGSVGGNNQQFFPHSFLVWPNFPVSLLGKECMSKLQVNLLLHNSPILWWSSYSSSPLTVPRKRPFHHVTHTASLSPSLTTVPVVITLPNLHDFPWRSNYSLKLDAPSP